MPSIAYTPGMLALLNLGLPPDFSAAQVRADLDAALERYFRGEHEFVDEMKRSYFTLPFGTVAIRTSRYLEITWVVMAHEIQEDWLIESGAFVSWCEPDEFILPQAPPASEQG